MFSQYTPENDECIQIETSIKTPSKLAMRLAKIDMKDNDEKSIFIRNNKLNKTTEFKIRKVKLEKAKYVLKSNPDVYFTYETKPYIQKRGDEFVEKIDDNLYVIQNKNIKKFIKVDDGDENEIIVYKYTKNKVKDGKGRPKKTDEVNNLNRHKIELYDDLIPKNTFKIEYEYIFV
jgi:hypothetical protein